MALIINVEDRAGQPIRVNIVPKNPCVEVFNTVQFTAIVENSTNGAVTWSVFGPDGTATINTAGLFTALASPSGENVIVRAISSADPKVYSDVYVDIVEDEGECCSPLVDISPSVLQLTPGETYEFDVYENGLLADNWNFNWEITGQGSVTPSGAYTAPTVITGEIYCIDYVHAISPSAELGCYGDTTIVVSNNPIYVKILPSTQTAALNETVTYTATVYGVGNQNVIWTVENYLEQLTNPISYTPTGYTTEALSITAPAVLPSNPYIRIRATSIIDPSIYDEAILQIVSSSIPFTYKHYTKYYVRERQVEYTYDSLENAWIATTSTPVAETVFQKTDPYKGLPEFTVSSIRQSWPVRINKTTITERTMPTGTSATYPIWVTAHDDYTILGLPASDPTYSAWARSYKIPMYSRVYLTINLTGTITSPTAEFLQHDFSSIGSTIDVITTNVHQSETLAFLSSTKITFVYYTTSGFFRGTQGAGFDPASDAYDIVKFTCYKDGNLYATTLYFRPEPELPEVFPEVAGPKITGALGMYIPGEVPTTITNKLEGTPMTYTSTPGNIVEWECEGDLCKVDWTNTTFGLFSDLPYTEQPAGTDINVETQYSQQTGIIKRTSVDLTAPVQPVYFMHYYHGMWLVACPAVCLPLRYWSTSGILASTVNTTTSSTTNTVVGGTSTTTNGTETTTNTVDEITSYVTQGTGDATTSTVNYFPVYQLKFQAIKNRHYMSHSPNLLSKSAYPCNLKFELVNEAIQVDARPTCSTRTATLPATNGSLTVAVGKETTFSTNIWTFTGPAKMMFLKVTPILFGGTYSKATYVPIFLYGVITSGQTISAETTDCYYNVKLRFFGYHLHATNWTYNVTTSWPENMWKHACGTWHNGADEVGGTLDGISIAVPRTPTTNLSTHTFAKLRVDGFVSLTRYVAGNDVFYSKMATDAEGSSITTADKIRQGVHSNFFVSVYSYNVTNTLYNF